MKQLLLIALLAFAASCNKGDSAKPGPITRDEIAARWAFKEEPTRYCDVAASGVLLFPEPIPKPLTGKGAPVIMQYVIGFSGPDTLRLTSGNARYPDFYFYKVGNVVFGFEEDKYGRLSEVGYNEIVQIP